MEKKLTVKELKKHLLFNEQARESIYEAEFNYLEEQGEGFIMQNIKKSGLAVGLDTEDMTPIERMETLLSTAYIFGYGMAIQKHNKAIESLIDDLAKDFKLERK